MKLSLLTGWRSWLLLLAGSLSACGGGTTASSSGSTTASTVNVFLTLPTAATVPHVGIATPIVLTFSAAINPSTIGSSNFIVGTAPGASNLGNGSMAVMSEDNSVLTFIPESALPLNTRIFISLQAGTVMDESGNYIEEEHSFTFVTQPLNYAVFVADNGRSGELGGVTGADAICAADPHCLSGMVCKAMLVDGVSRDATNNNGAGTNWVLQASTQYRNGANQIVGISQASPAIFNFPLKAPLGGMDFAASNAWTGMYPDWSSDLTANCGQWNSSMGLGASGLTTASLADAISTSPTMLCASPAALYCVEQPK